MQSLSPQVLPAISAGNLTPSSVAPTHRAALHFPASTSRALDFAMALACSLVLHLGLLWGDVLFLPAPPPRLQRPAEPPLIRMEMPELPPDKPDEIVDLQETNAEPQLAPPSLADIPLVVPIDAFTQPLQPPAPPGIQVGQGITIPVGKPGQGFGHGIQNLFDIANLDQRPILRAAIQPDYPYQMRHDAIEGSVSVEFIIDYKGDVIAVHVISSSHAAFEFPAVRAVEKWKFQPGRKAGRAVNTRVQQTVKFSLEHE